jgi:hypothetical protein
MDELTPETAAELLSLHEARTLQDLHGMDELICILNTNHALGNTTFVLAVRKAVRVRHCELPVPPLRRLGDDARFGHINDYNGSRCM